MLNEQRQIIKKYIDILLRRKAILISCFIIGIAAGLGLYLTNPKIYESTALLKYQRQSVNPTKMSPDDLRTQTREVVETVTQQIMSRSSLEGIIIQHDLYKYMRNTMLMEDIVDIMRDNDIHTNLVINSDVFQVSYQGEDPDKVMKVTNALAAKFIEENLRYRQEQASQTTTYVRDELKMAKNALDDKEQVMRDYKLKYYNEMPEQLENNTNRLNALQEQYQNNQSSSLELERTRLLIQDQITQRKAYINQVSTGKVTARPDQERSAALNTPQKVRLRLQQLSTRYKEGHPEIKRLKKLLKELENQQTALGSDSDSTSAVKQIDPQVLELRQQFKEVQIKIQRLNQERKNLTKLIKKYEDWIAATPVREAEWSGLTRDYEQFNEHYQSLVTQKLQAESAHSLEKQLKGSQFKIIDPAYLPEKPIKPNFSRIILVSVCFCLGLGGALALGLEQLTTAFKDPFELEDYLDLPVVCAIPLLPTKKELFKSRLKVVSTYSFLTFLGGITFGALFYFWYKGAIII